MPTNFKHNFSSNFFVFLFSLGFHLGISTRFCHALASPRNSSIGFKIVWARRPFKNIFYYSRRCTVVQDVQQNVNRPLQSFDFRKHQTLSYSSTRNNGEMKNVATSFNQKKKIHSANIIRAFSLTGHPVHTRFNDIVPAE